MLAGTASGCRTVPASGFQNENHVRPMRRVFRQPISGELYALIACADALDDQSGRFSRSWHNAENVAPAHAAGV